MESLSAVPEMASDDSNLSLIQGKSALRRMWEFPAIVHFLTVFRQQLSLTTYGCDEVEHALLLPQNNVTCNTIMWHLVYTRGQHKDSLKTLKQMEPDGWHAVLWRMLDNHVLDPYGLSLTVDTQNSTFYHLRAPERCSLVHTLCVYRAVMSDSVQNAIIRNFQVFEHFKKAKRQLRGYGTSQSDKARAARASWHEKLIAKRGQCGALGLSLRPIGVDAQGNRYFRVADDAWLFRESHSAQREGKKATGWNTVRERQAVLDQWKRVAQTRRSTVAQERAALVNAMVQLTEYNSKSALRLISLSEQVIQKRRSELEMCLDGLDAIEGYRASREAGGESKSVVKKRPRDSDNPSQQRSKVRVTEMVVLPSSSKPVFLAEEAAGVKVAARRAVTAVRQSESHDSALQSFQAYQAGLDQGNQPTTKAPPGSNADWRERSVVLRGRSSFRSVFNEHMDVDFLSPMNHMEVVCTTLSELKAFAQSLANELPFAVLLNNRVIPCLNETYETKQRQIQRRLALQVLPRKRSMRIRGHKLRQQQKAQEEAEMARRRQEERERARKARQEREQKRANEAREQRARDRDLQRTAERDRRARRRLGLSDSSSSSSGSEDSSSGSSDWTSSSEESSSSSEESSSESSTDQKPAEKKKRRVATKPASSTPDPLRAAKARQHREALQRRRALRMMRRQQVRTQPFDPTDPMGEHVIVIGAHVFEPTGFRVRCGDLLGSVPSITLDKIPTHAQPEQPGPVAGVVTNTGGGAVAMVSSDGPTLSSALTTTTATTAASTPSISTTTTTTSISASTTTTSAAPAVSSATTNTTTTTTTANANKPAISTTATATASQTALLSLQEQVRMFQANPKQYPLIRKPRRKKPAAKKKKPAAKKKKPAAKKKAPAAKKEAPTAVQSSAGQPATGVQQSPAANGSGVQGSSSIKPAAARAPATLASGTAVSIVVQTQDGGADVSAPSIMAATAKPTPLGAPSAQSGVGDVTTTDTGVGAGSASVEVDSVLPSACTPAGATMIATPVNTPSVSAAVVKPAPGHVGVSAIDMHIGVSSSSGGASARSLVSNPIPAVAHSDPSAPSSQSTVPMSTSVASAISAGASVSTNSDGPSDRSFGLSGVSAGTGHGAMPIHVNHASAYAQDTSAPLNYVNQVPAQVPAPSSSADPSAHASQSENALNVQQGSDTQTHSQTVQNEAPMSDI